LETAIRQALERADRASPETRARIYQSARNALEAGLRKQNVHDDAVVAEQRQRLEYAIHAIEQQERAALKAQADVEAPQPMATHPATAFPSSPRAPAVEDPRPDRHSTSASAARAAGVAASRPQRAETDFGAVRADDQLRGPVATGGALPYDPVRASSLDDRGREPDDSRIDGLADDRRSTRHEAEMPMVAPMRGGKRPGAEARDRVNDLGLPGVEPLVPRRKRGRGGRILSFLMVVSVLVAAIGSAVWWVMSTGLLERPSGPATSPPTTSAEDFDGSAGLRTLGAQAGFTADWVDLYVPDKAGEAAAGAVAAGPRGRTDVVRDESGTRLHIVSGTGDAAGNVAIEVPASALQQMSGRTSTLALSVQGPSGKPTQFSVECDFASLGDCGRHRFTVNDEKSDMLFKVTFDRTLSPNAPGRILVNSDVTGAGAPLDLFGVRLLPGQ
jgi:hypothetical protein